MYTINRITDDTCDLLISKSCHGVGRLELFQPYEFSTTVYVIKTVCFLMTRGLYWMEEENIYGRTDRPAAMLYALS